MSTNKLCYVTNIAAHYRSAIYLLMDKTFNMDFIFGDHPADKRFDVSLLHNPVKVIQNTQITKSVDYQRGIPLLFTKYDTILITGATHCLSTWLLLLFAYPFKKKKVYLWSHGWYGKESKKETYLKKLFFGLASGTFVYGDRAKRLMVENGLNGDKIWPIHNCLDHERHLMIRSKLETTTIFKDKFMNDYHNLIFIGRLIAAKRLELALDALKICKDKGVNLNMTFIGDGPVREALLRRAESLGVHRNIWFYGACHDEIINAELLYNADLCVSPGNVGLTAIHSMTFGTPVITSDDYSHQGPEFEAIIPSKTGSFFKSGDPIALANSIMEWFLNKTGREIIRNNCYDVIDTEWTPEYQINLMKEHLL